MLYTSTHSGAGVLPVVRPLLFDDEQSPGEGARPRGAGSLVNAIPFVVLFGLWEFFGFDITGPSNRDFALFLDTAAGQEFLRGAWGWFVVVDLTLITRYLKVSYAFHDAHLVSFVDRARRGGPETGEAQIINAGDGALILRISEGPPNREGG